MKKYYAVQFTSGKNTTTGEANSRTGRMSKAVDLVSFSKKETRDNWVENGKITSDMQGGNCRKSVTKQEARDLHLGETLAEFNEMLERMLDEDK